MDNTCILYQYEDIQIIENAEFFHHARDPCTVSYQFILEKIKPSPFSFLQMEIKVFFADQLSELLLAYEKVGTAFSLA